MSLCLLGGPKSGKSTQLENIIKRFDIKQIKSAHPPACRSRHELIPGESGSDDLASLEKQVQEAVDNAKDGKKPRVIIEGFPRTMQLADKFEAQIAPILVIISIVLDAPKALDRIESKVDRNDAKINWKRFDESSAPIIKKFRFQGNILEVSWSQFLKRHEGL